MKCILHIGTEKTGTTTLQHFLYANRESLKKKGFGVVASVGVGNNRGIASYSMSDNKLNDDYFITNKIYTLQQKKQHDLGVENKLQNEIESLDRDGCHTILISSEHFHSRCTLESEVYRVKSLLSGYFKEFKIVCYLRPQVDMAISLYSTVLRAGSKVNFKDFIENNCFEKNIYYDYSKLLERWSNCFGEEAILPKIFEKDKLNSGDVVKDYLKLIGINDFNDFVFFNSSNESLTPFGQELLRLNNIYQYDFQFEQMPFNEYMYKMVNQFFVGKGCQPSSQEAINIQQQFDKINQAVARKWFSEKKLFCLNYDKYQEKKLDDSEQSVLELLFKINNKNIFPRLSNNNKDSFFSSVIDRLSSDSQSADILREVAFAFEQSGDIETAKKVMYQAHLLRPEGPVIKQKLTEYTQKLETTTPSIPPEGIETIKQIGHRDYVGGLWEEIGQLQFNFLKSQGLKPEHKLLDIACGSLRAGVHFIDYLNTGHYLGLEKEAELVARGIEQELGKDKKAQKKPEFVINSHFDFTQLTQKPDYALAQSLFTHLIEKDIVLCLSNLKEFMQGKPLSFYVTFFECDTPQQGELTYSHSHAKFEYTKQQMQQFGKETGWDMEYIGDWNHPRGQKMVRYY